MYTQKATSKTPVLVVYLLDISGSMTAKLSNTTRIDAVNEALKQIVVQMVGRSTRGKMVSPRYKIAVLAYERKVHDVLGGVQTIDVFARGGVPEFDAVGDATDTKKAFEEAEQLLKQMLPNMQDCPAPLVCHMTDGEYNEGGNPEPVAKRIMGMSVPDGNVLIENIFISNSILKNPISDPFKWAGVSENDLADDYAKTLYGMSSPLPESYASEIAKLGYTLEPGRKMLYPGENYELVRLAFTMSGMTPRGKEHGAG